MATTLPSLIDKVTDDDVAALRDQVDEPSTFPYTDDFIKEIIQSYPLVDANRQNAFVYDGDLVLVHSLWVPTWDMNAAEAAMWTVKIKAAVSDDVLTTFRGMIAETSVYPYSDDFLRAIVITYAHEDVYANPVWDVRHAGKKRLHADWNPSFDLNGAAAEMWQLKVNTLIGQGAFPYSDGGQTFQRDVMLKQYQEQAKYYRDRRRVKRIAVLHEPVRNRWNI
jgi:hypothetical protein